jgi:hypothetical protein
MGIFYEIKSAKGRQLFLIGIVCILVVFSSWLAHESISARRMLSGYVIAAVQDRVYTPLYKADDYFNDQHGVMAWRFTLDAEKQQELTAYRERFPEIWYELDEEAFEIIHSQYRNNSKVDLVDLSEDAVSYCILDLNQNTFIQAKETSWGKYAIFLWDSGKSQYYCLYISGK